MQTGPVVADAPDADPVCPRYLMGDVTVAERNEEVNSEAGRGSTWRRVARPSLATVLRIFLVGLFLQLSGCREPGSRTTPQTLRFDSAGIEIVRNQAPLRGQGRRFRVEPKPNLEIGRVLGADEETFYDVVSVRQDDANILVAERTEIRLYSQAGALIRRMGGVGHGPGEFTRIVGALFCGGRIVASDLSPPRVTIFDEMDQAQTIPLPRPTELGFLDTLLPLFGCTTHGFVGGMANRKAETQRSTTQTVQRNARLVVHVRDSNERVDTILAYPGQETFHGLVVPFGRNTLVAFHDELLYVADTGTPEVRILGLNGTVHRIVRLALEAVPVSPNDIQRIRDQYLGGLPTGLREEVQARLAAVPIPPTLPFFSRLEVASDGTIWLQSYQRFQDERITGWNLINADGVWLGEIDLPEGFFVHEFGEHDAVGVWEDSLGVEFIHRHEILY
jgi:hypothetical protein